MKNHLATRWVVALRSEAKAIFRHYQMSAIDNEGPYPIFKDLTDDHWLAVSGVGRVNSAAATMYLHQISHSPPWSIWINIGIAGYGGDSYGELFLVDKIIERSTQRCLYPRLPICSALSSENLVTVDQPESSYPGIELYDMEGSAFFQIASRLTCQQLVIVLKIASDGPKSDINQLTSIEISRLISDKIQIISDLVSRVEDLAKIEFDRLSLPRVYFYLVEKWHFSKTQKHQLKRLINRWQSIFPLEDLPFELEKHNDAKSAIKGLNKKLAVNEVDWDKP
ncbi:MAG: hypothetical protein VX617_01345 [Pseudomonadota bacterium]|nr:hypothetical protein [Pseudomonadota bacterium]